MAFILKIKRASECDLYPASAPSGLMLTVDIDSARHYRSRVNATEARRQWRAAMMLLGVSADLTVLEIDT